MNKFLCILVLILICGCSEPAPIPSEVGKALIDACVARGGTPSIFNSTVVSRIDCVIKEDFDE